MAPAPYLEALSASDSLRQRALRRRRSGSADRLGPNARPFPCSNQLEPAVGRAGRAWLVRLRKPSLLRTRSASFLRGSGLREVGLPGPLADASGPGTQLIGTCRTRRRTLGNFQRGTFMLEVLTSSWAGAAGEE
ncbi:Triple Functional Domain Protein [Manis pentadactyla]|nr:Triple Functional Domain Protein [Manis pentadactyla]